MPLWPDFAFLCLFSLALLINIFYAPYTYYFTGFL